MLAMLYSRQEFALRRAVALEFIRNKHAWHVGEALQQFTEELLGCLLVPPPLHQDVEHVPVLIHRPPEIMPFTVDGKEHLIQVPLIAWPGTSTAQLIGVLLTELAAPLPDGFIRDDDPTSEQEFFHIPVAQAESEIQPHPMADDLGREAMILVAVEGWCVHVTSMAHPARARQAAQQVDKAGVKPFPCRGLQYLFSAGDSFALTGPNC